MITARDPFGDDHDAKLRALAMDSGFDYSQDISDPDPELLSLLPARIARMFHAIPSVKTGDGVIIHIHDPLDFEALDAIRHTMKEDLNPVVTPKEIIDKAIDKAYK